MPRKTKKEKMAAALHRLQRQVESAPNQPTSTHPETSNKVSLEQIGIKTQPVKTQPYQANSQGKSRYEYSYVSNDLRKIVFLGGLAILLEFGLSLTLGLNSVKVFLRTIGLEI
jgi:hypothetical protein